MLRSIYLRALSGVVVLGTLGACGGGGSSSAPPSPPPPPPPVTYTIGGTVSGLVGNVVLQNNAGNNLTVSASGSFTFSTAVNSGEAYAVTVLTQPTGQACTVSTGSGTATANVTSVQVTCTTNPLALSSSTPTNNAAGVDRSIAPAMVFSAALDAATVTTTNVTLSSAAGDQAIALSASGTQLTATPSRQLLPMTTYTLRAATGVRGSAGEQLAAAATTSFTTRDGQWRAPALVEFDNAGDASSPQIALDASGNALAVWSQSDGTRYNIWANRHAPGVGWGAATPIETDNGNAQYPQIALDTSGNALAVWQQYDGTRYNIWASRYVVGTGWGIATLIETDNAGNATTPQIALDASGNALAVWEQYDGTRYNIWASRYVVGTGWGTVTLIETDNGNAQYPQIALDTSGNALAVWQQYDGTRYNIWANRYATGTGWGTAAPIEIENAGGAFYPQIALDASGNALAVWYQYDGARYNILANRYVVGTGWGIATLIETDNAGNATTPQIALDANGNALAVWEQSDGTRYNTWANRYVVGTGWGTAALIETNNAGEASFAQIAFDASGNALAVWQQYDGTRSNIWANRYAVSTGWGTATQLELDNGSAGNSQIALDANGNALAVWEQSDGTRFNIQTARFD
jgi:hypothetical protein